MAIVTTLMASPIFKRVYRRPTVIEDESINVNALSPVDGGIV
ncbi:MAG: hypothetical protein ACRER2_07560 [Methylococcales bacterium]